MGKPLGGFSNDAIEPMNLAGATAKDRRLWHSYVFVARNVIEPSTARQPSLEIAARGRRLTGAQEQGLQGIVFAAFLLEFRIKRIFEELGLQVRSRDTLGRLLEIFRARIEGHALPSGKKVNLGGRWLSLEKRLKMLNKRRNDIAHANYRKLDRLLTARPRRIAAQSFNAVVDFIELTNTAIGYDRRTAAERRAHYGALKVHVP